jgi:hypothetical protein
VIGSVKVKPWAGGWTGREQKYDETSVAPSKVTEPVPQQVMPLKSEIANCESLKSDLLKY